MDNTDAPKTPNANEIPQDMPELKESNEEHNTQEAEKEPTPTVPGWYVGREGKRLGPFHLEDVVRKLDKGDVSLTDLCWKKGMKEWTPLGAVPEVVSAYERIGKGAKREDIAAEIKKAKEKAGQIARAGTARVKKIAEDQNVRKVAATSKTATLNAFSAFKTFIFNPMGGLPIAYDKIGSMNSMFVGIVFIVVYELLCLFSMKSMMGGMALPVGEWFKIIIALLVPAAGMFVALTIVRFIARSKETFHADIFVTGSFVLILGIMAFLSLLIGKQNTEIVMVIILVGLCYEIILLYSALNRIHTISESLATFGVPLLIIVCAWVSKTLWSNIMPEIIGGMF
jgi:hypothetical protein